MKFNYNVQFIFDFDDKISKSEFDDFVVAKLAEIGIDFSLPWGIGDNQYVAILRDKIFNK